MKIFSPAKINFFLHVRAKRPDGYHELFSLMCRIHLFDEVSLQIGGIHKGVVEIHCSHPKVPADATNLAHRAARLFQSQLHTAPGIKIHLKKHIPVGAGLGGGQQQCCQCSAGIKHPLWAPFFTEASHGNGA